MNTTVQKWLDIKAMRIKGKYTRFYAYVVKRGLRALILAKEKGMKRRDGSILHWKPEMIGPDELEIVLEEYGHRRYYANRFKDFLEYYGNNIFKRYPWTPTIPTKRNYTYYSIEEMDLIFEESRKYEPVVELVVHCLYLSMRPIGVFNLKMTGIDWEYGTFTTRDKGRDPDDRQKGKPRIIVWDPDTIYCLQRYLDWREKEYQKHEDIRGEPIPRSERLFIYSEPGKIKPYKTSGSLIQKLKYFKKSLAEKGIDFKPYNIRKTVIDEMYVMTIFEGSEMSKSQIRTHMDWQSEKTLEDYNSKRAKLLEKLEIKEKQLKYRKKIKEKFSRKGYYVRAQN